MSTVPPNLAGSVLQSHVVQRQVSRVRNGEEAHKASATRQQAAAIDESDTTVSTEDQDTQVHSDAQGTGSQGRAFSSPQEAEELEPQADDSDSISGDEGQHIDLEA